MRTRFLSAMLLLFCLSPLTPAQPRSARTPAPDPEQTLARAIQLHQAGDLDAAIREYHAFLALRPERVEARSNLGAALSRLGRYSEAVEQYQRALILDRDNPAIRLNLAIAWYKMARITDASRELEQLAAKQPDNSRIVLLLADCYLQLGEYNKVIVLLSPHELRHRGDGPEDRALAYLLGTALIREKQTTAGQAMIERIMRAGQSAEAHLLVGTTYLIIGEAANAVGELEAAIKLNPKLPTLHTAYGRALALTGNTDRASAAFRQELENNPNDFEANVQLGVILKQDQKPEEALPCFERALLVRPGEPNARFYIQTIRIAQGKLQEALPELEKLTRDAPDFVEAHVQLASVYYRLKRKADGDREQVIIARLNAERQARQAGAKAADKEAAKPRTTP
ncbi:MAG: tetratricopeptide repeat protein [Blastocatellia bacterium]